MSDRYKKSEELLERALKTVPLGSQTFSKSKTQFPVGISPYFAKKAKGAYIWDVDDNKYVDYLNCLLAITLGYGDEDVLKAVQDQLQDGTLFSFAHPLEFELAEKIKEMVPSAEMVRFGKNGSDATAGAIRVARAVTKKDHVLVCGYHGWQDWYIGSTSRNLGVPESTSKLTHAFAYNNIDSVKELFKEYKDNIAAVIMEPSNVIAPEAGFLANVKELAHQNNALFIFDETITGFRFANGGAQELYDVTPDLSTFGKGLANGFAVSAVVGKEEYMKVMEEIFFSFTFGGETLSLAAAKATLTKLQNVPVVETIGKMGTLLMSRLTEKIKHYGLEEFHTVKGHPSWSFLIFNETEKYNIFHLKTLFMQEMLADGIVTFGTHNMSYAHGEKEIELLMAGYDKYFDKFRDIIDGKKSVVDQLRCEPIVPLFKVR